MQSAHFPSIHMPDDSTHPAPDARRPTATGADADPNATHAVPEASSPQMLRPAAVTKSEPRIGHLTVEREIGSGGMGVVYSVLNQRTGRREALKVPREAVRDPASLDRFRREYMIQQGLGEHPNLVRVFETGVFTDSAGVEKPYYTMECVEGGRTLRTLIDEGVPRRRLVEIMAKVAGAIAHAAQKHVHHGDLKPSNVLIRDNGEPAVSDFGVARNLSVEQSTRQVTASLGRAIGTYDYMSPEQASSASALASQTDDVYTLGVMLYEVIAGRRPYAVAPSPGVTLAEAIRRAHIAPLLVPDHRGRPRRADAWLRRIVRRALGRDEHRADQPRYQSAEEMSKALRSYLGATRVLSWRPTSPFRGATPGFAGLLVLAALVARLVIGQSANTHAYATLEPGQWFHSRAMSSSAAAPVELNSVAVITIDPRTDLAGLTRTHAPRAPAFEDGAVYPARALHGELARRLVQASPKVVCWDLLFAPRAESPPFDALLAEGIAELRAAGVGVVVGSLNWDRHPQTRRPLDVSETILNSGARVGGVTYIIGKYPLQFDMYFFDAARRRVYPSLAAEAYAQWRCAGCGVDIEVSFEDAEATLSFWKPVPGAEGERASIGDSVTLRLSRVTRDDEASQEANAEVGFKPGDWQLTSVVTIPEASELETISVPLQMVMAMDEQQMRERFAGKCVLIGTAIPGIDEIVIPDDSGRKCFGVHGHAVATANLINNRVPQVPDLGQDATFLLWAAGLGVLPFVFVRPRTLGTLAWIVLVTVGVLWYCASRASQGGMLIDPFPLIACAGLAAALASVLRELAERVWLLDSGS